MCQVYVRQRNSISLTEATKMLYNLSPHQSLERRIDTEGKPFIFLGHAEG